MNDSNLECNLTFINSNSSVLTDAIFRLEESGCPLSTSIKIVLSAKNKIGLVQNEIGKAKQLQILTVVENYTGFIGSVSI